MKNEHEITTLDITIEQYYLDEQFKNLTDEEIIEYVMELMDRVDFTHEANSIVNSYMSTGSISSEDKIKLIGVLKLANCICTEQE